jgi:hypothetical protein
MSAPEQTLKVQGKEAWVRWAIPSAVSLGRIVSICFSQKDDCWKALILRDDGTFCEHPVGDLKVRNG